MKDTLDADYDSVGKVFQGFKMSSKLGFRTKSSHSSFKRFSAVGTKRIVDLIPEDSLTR